MWFLQNTDIPKDGYKKLLNQKEQCIGDGVCAHIYRAFHDEEQIDENNRNWLHQLERNRCFVIKTVWK